MKVLQVNCVYKKGSTGKIVYELHKGLTASGIDSVVCYGRGEQCNEKNVYKVCGEFYSYLNHFWALLRGQVYGGCYFSTRKLIGVIKKENPDIVHLQCINGFFVNIPQIVTWLKKKNINTVITLHAEFMFTANCGHARECEKWKMGCGKCPQLKSDLKVFGIDGTHRSWKKMKKAFDGYRQHLAIVSVSPWLMGRAKQSPFLADKDHYVVMNGLDAEIFSRKEVSELRKKYDLDKKIVLFATTELTDREDDLKGGRYVIELAKQLIDEKIIFLIAGHYDKALMLPENMVMLGHLRDQNELAEYYSIADVTILVSLRETFSMVTVESLCCGTPVVGFEAGGPESIALPEYGKFVPQGDLGALKDVLLSVLKKDIDRDELGARARRCYSGERMTEEYIKIYQSLAEEK